MHRMNSMNPLHDNAAELIKAAQSFHSAASQPGILGAAPLSLARTEEALQLLSGAWYQLAADSSGVDRLSHEQEARLTATLQVGGHACARRMRQRRGDRVPAHARDPGARPVAGRQRQMGVAWRRNWCSDP
jgi:hypothetical protein